jgi:hypothetical protein
MPALQSHTIDKRGNLGEGQKIYKCFLLRDEYCIATREHRWNDTPYWAMQMPVEFVPDHGNIFRNEFRTLLMQFLPSPVEMKARGTTRTQTRFLQEKKSTP